MDEAMVGCIRDGARNLREFVSTNVAESMYLVGLLFFLIQGFLDTTMFAYVMPASAIPILKGIAFGIIALKIIIFDFRTSIRHTVLTLSLLGIGALSILFDGYTAPFQFVLMVVGAFRVDFDRIARLYFWVSVSLTVITFVAGFTGLIPNVAVSREVGTVYSYGFYYITEFSAHVLSITLVWIYLNRSNLSGRVYLPAIIWSSAVFILVNGKMSFLLSLLVMVAIAISEVRQGRMGISYCFPRVLIYSFNVMAVISLILMVCYTYSGALAWLNDLLTNRLYYAHEAFTRYGITAFGKQIEMLGWGGGKSVQYQDYFYIDCSYVNILLRYGYIILLMVLTLCTVPLFRIRKSAGVIAWLLFGIAIASFVNEHLMSIPYNIFVLMAFANYSEYVPKHLTKNTTNALRGM